MRLALAASVFIVLTAALWRVTRPDIRPFQITGIPGNITSLDMSPAGTLYAVSRDFDDTNDAFETQIDVASGSMTTRKIDPSNVPAFAAGRQVWYAKNGSRLIAPLAGPDLASSGTHPVLLYLVQPDGTVVPLTRIGKITGIVSGTFSPDCRHFSAVVQDNLDDIDLASQTIRRRKLTGWSWLQVRHIKTNPPNMSQQVNKIVCGLGRALSPDGRFVLGYDRDILLQDAHNGKNLHRVPMPTESSLAFWGDLANARWTADSQYALVASSQWRGIVCIRASDGKSSRNGAWDPTIAQHSSSVWSVGNHLIADKEDGVILLRDSVTGQIKRRSRGALNAAGEFPELLAITPTGDAIYFQLHGKNSLPENNLWRWPTTPE